MFVRSLLPRFFALTLGIGLLTSTGPVAAQDDPEPVSPLSSPMLHGKLELTLEGAIQMGLENNLDVQVSRYAPVIAEFDEEIAWGAYDPESYAEFGWADIKDPNSNVLFGTTRNQNTSLDGFGGVRGLVPMLGSVYSLELEGSRTTTNSSIAGISPELRSGVSFNFTQPLLRDLIWNRPWTQVKTSRLLLDASREDFRRAVMDVVTSIEDAYWGLIAADERVRVAHKSLETAQALQDQTDTQYEVGVVSKVEVTQATAGVAAREFNVIVAENAYRNQQDVLIDRVLGPHLRASSTLEIVPTDRPEEYIVYDIDIETAVARAFENRPELAQAAKEIERQEVQVAFAKNQRLPQLDAVVGYGLGGLGGSANPNFGCAQFTSELIDPTDPTQGTVPGGSRACQLGTLDPSTSFFVKPKTYGQTFNDYWTNRGGSNFVARGVFSLPFPNTVANSTLSRTEIELRRANTQQRRLSQTIILEVRRSARDLGAAQEGIESAEKARLAADEQLRAEKIRLEYGESTPFDVLQREEQLVDREVERIEAFRVYRSSATGLDRAQGTILRNRNIKIEDVSTLR